MALCLVSSLLSPAEAATKITLSGVVKAKDGSGPISGIHVCLLGTNRRPCDTTDGSGRYSVSFPKGTYALTATDEDLDGSWVRQARRGGKKLRLTKSLVLNWSMVRGATISGRLRAPGGGDPSHGELEVSAFRFADGRAGAEEISLSNVGGDGSFFVTKLPPGRIALRVKDNSARPSFASQWYPNASAASTSKPITVRTAQAVTGTEITLNPSSTLRVRVTSRGEGIESTVKIVDRDGRSLAETYTDARGLVVFGGLHAGSYKLKASPHQVAYTEWFSNHHDVKKANPVKVAGATTTNRTFALHFPTLRATKKPSVKVKDGAVVASGGTWNATPERRLFRWFRDSTWMKSESGRSYDLRKADRGHRVHVCIVAMRVGYADGRSCSSPSRKITG